MSSLKQIIGLLALMALVFCVSIEAKLMRHSRYFDDSMGYGSPYGGPTGERAIVTVRGARSPYDGSAPSKITIEDDPYRGPYPRGVYDRLDAGYGPRMPMYPRHGGYGGYNSNYGGYNSGYNGGYNSFYGAPSRIAVTGAYPIGYGSRYP